MEIFIPKEVSFLIDTIYENGYEAFMVGGCVRDGILNLTPNDYDITTSATPQEIMNIFKDYKIIDTGIKHGTVSIILNNNIYEITTYRIEGEYENNRRPKNVEFTSNIEEDLKRRDFTIRDLSKFGTLLSGGEPMKKGKQYTLRDGDSFYVLSPEYTFKVVIET